jgi:hypothetical protein
VLSKPQLTLAQARPDPSASTSKLLHVAFLLRAMPRPSAKIKTTTTTTSCCWKTLYFAFI